MRCEKLIRVIMQPIRKRFLLKKMRIKEARKRFFMDFKRLSKVFSRKKGELSLLILCFSYE